MTTLTFIVGGWALYGLGLWMGNRISTRRLQSEVANKDFLVDYLGVTLDAVNDSRDKAWARVHEKDDEIEALKAENERLMDCIIDIENEMGGAGMREIKFRYIVTEPAKNITHRLYHTLEGIERLDPSHPIFKPSYEIVSRDLYTGLKDKNGVEIYEKDIFKAAHDFGPGGMRERISSVAFNSRKGYQWEYWDLDTIEVIGNIYEHPHLLEAVE